MFSKETKAAGGEKRTRVPSIISANLQIVGDLVSEGDVQIDGIVEGDVHARSLTVSEGAAIKGQIIAESACIRGRVEGQITADQVELGRTAKVLGDIIHADLSIHSGAFLEGSCRHRQQSVEQIPALSGDDDDEAPDLREHVAASA
jgi:cytoskeletal protein CcmA (bactofilin family)